MTELETIHLCLDNLESVSKAAPPGGNQLPAARSRDPPLEDLAGRDDSSAPAEGKGTAMMEEQDFVRVPRADLLSILSRLEALEDLIRRGGRPPASETQPP